MFRTRRIWTAVLCVLLLLPVQGLAQDLVRGARGYELAPDSMPSWTVPVLRLVSSTHVEPTTGVIISGTGLVLVPAEFADGSDEIIILDGGTDIIRNGRPAKIERKFQAVGLQVLSVEGLKRQGPTLATEPLRDGGQVTLHAFPPAEQIAEGEPPLNQSATVAIFSENERPSISAETQLPNVTGALSDNCGNLVGVSLADGIQTMEPAATGYRWGDILLDILEAMQVTPRTAPCVDDTAAQEEEPEAEDEPAPEPIEEEPAEEPLPEEPAEPEPEEEPLPEPVEEEPAGPEIEILPPLEKDSPAASPATEESARSSWWWLVAAMVLLGLGLVLHLLRKSSPTGAAAEEAGSPAGLPPAADDGDEDEEISPTGPLLDCLLLVRGVLGDGTEVECSCPVSPNAINLFIGRGDADLVIDSPAVSRRHAVLNGSAGEMTISDLGSSNGTSINGVPCMEGEILFIEPGDSLVLGDVRLSIEIGPREADGGGDI